MVAKAQVYRQLSASLTDAARDTDALLRESLGHPDAKEGAASFFERRPPKFAAWTGNDG
jgi:enoyl-CoA hydratase/carnithine racemase